MISLFRDLARFKEFLASVFHCFPVKKRPIGCYISWNTFHRCGDVVFIIFFLKGEFKTVIVNIGTTCGLLVKFLAQLYCHSVVYAEEH